MKMGRNSRIGCTKIPNPSKNPSIIMKRFALVSRYSPAKNAAQRKIAEE